MIKWNQFPNKPKVFGNHHFDDDDSIDDEFPCEPIDISFSQENYSFKYLDQEYDSVKEYFLIETSSYITIPHAM